MSGCWDGVRSVSVQPALDGARAVEGDALSAIRLTHVTHADEVGGGHAVGGDDFGGLHNSGVSSGLELFFKNSIMFKLFFFSAELFCKNI